MKLVTIVGARPQFIKAATVSRVLRESADIAETLVHTGQHYDHGMSEVFFDELDIPRPAYNLGIGSGSHGKQTGQMLELIEELLQQEAPDRVLVYGDTNSTLAGALAAAKLHIPVAHVEAGLRSFNRAMPEEINRILTDHVSDRLFAPTPNAARQLGCEGVRSETIHQVGDVMFDAALYYADAATAKSHILADQGLAPKDYVLATVHRAENTDDPAKLESIAKGLSALADRLPVVLPLHPRTRGALERSGLLDTLQRQLAVIAPVGYLDMIQLERNARVIVTDSGGVQKEAFFYRTPCITLREETEWVELVEHGYNKIVGADCEHMLSAYAQLDGQSLDWSTPLYGSGNASGEIVDILGRP